MGRVMVKYHPKTIVDSIPFPFSRRKCRAGTLPFLFVPF
jgi:hypothetical protein